MDNNYSREDIFFFCYLVENLMRITLNNKPTIINSMTDAYIENIVKYAEVYHCESLEQLMDENIEHLKLTKGRFNPVGKSLYTVPTADDMASLYTRLIMKYDDTKPTVSNIRSVMSSEITEVIDNYNYAFYYENEDYILECIKENKIIMYGTDL